MRRVAMLLGLALLGCDDEASPTVDPCGHGAAPLVELGQGVGGQFTPLEAGQTVGLAVAPQGGFGVTVLARTEGLTASDDTLVSVRLETLIDGAVTGSFLLEEAPAFCQSDGQGGLITGIVVGFDPVVYASNDDLLELDGQRVELRVTVTDPDGVRGVGSEEVVVKVGQ